jgi:hypothetical protein
MPEYLVAWELEVWRKVRLEVVNWVGSSTECHKVSIIMPFGV